MNIDEKKKFALNLYYSEIKVRHSSLITIIVFEVVSIFEVVFIFELVFIFVL